MPPSITTHLPNLIVKTEAYPFVSLGTTPGNSSSTLIGWEAVKFC